MTGWLVAVPGTHLKGNTGESHVHKTSDVGYCYRFRNSDMCKNTCKWCLNMKV